jgi:hypothetical protein
MSPAAGPLSTARSASTARSSTSWSPSAVTPRQHGHSSRALGHGPAPAEVTTDRAPVYPRVLADLAPAARHVLDQYANNVVEADHRRLKARLRPMRGLKNDPLAAHGRGPARLRSEPAPRPPRARHRCARPRSTPRRLHRARSLPLTADLAPHPALGCSQINQRNSAAETKRTKERAQRRRRPGTGKQPAHAAVAQQVQVTDRISAGDHPTDHAGHLRLAPPGMLRCRSASAPSPIRPAKPSTGTSPALDTRFGSENDADARAAA